MAAVLQDGPPSAQTDQSLLAHVKCIATLWKHKNTGRCIWCFVLNHCCPICEIGGRWTMTLCPGGIKESNDWDNTWTKFHSAACSGSQIPVVPSLRDEAMNLWEWQLWKKSPQSQPDPDFQHKEEMHWSQERNSHSAEAAENWVCSVCLCGACVWALIKERRFFKHIRAILSNCFTPSSISTRTKDTDCGTKQCSPALLCTITLSRPGADTNRQDQRN